MINDQEEKFSQLYFLDTATATATRKNYSPNKKCDEQLLKDLDKHLRLINPYSQIFMKLNEVVSSTGKNNIEDYHIRFFNSNRPEDKKFTPPTCEEVAAIHTGENGLASIAYDFAVFYKTPLNTPSMINLKSTSSHTLPMLYPLFFPQGEQGWSTDLQRDQ